MKKTFKRAGVAVLSMAMLLSMGAVGAMSASAVSTISATANQKYILPDTTQKYTVYKVASAAVKDQDVYNYAVATKTTDIDSIGFDTVLTDGTGNDAGKLLYSGTALSTSTTSATTLKTIANALKTQAANEDAVTGLSLKDGGTTITITDAGYYLIVSNDSTAAPILLSVRSDDGHQTTALQLTDKSTGVTVKKYITSVGTATNGYVGSIDTTDSDYDASTNEVSHRAVGGEGATVSYKIVTKTPKYDTSVSSLSHSFTIKDTPEDSIVVGSTGDSGSKKPVLTSVTVDGNNVSESTSTYTTSYDETDGSFTITFKDEYILAKSGEAFINQDKDVVVTFNATLTNADTGTDSNKNGVDISYDNDFQTDGAADTEGDHKGTDHDGTDLYSAELDVLKQFDGVTVSGDKTATFQIYKYSGNTKGAAIGSAKTVNSTTTTAQFTGLAAGKYLIEETSATSGYKLVNPIVLEVGASYTGDFTYTATDSVTSSTVTVTETSGKGNTTVNNISGQTLPGTGGMGTVLFTVGGAAIVLAAGAMFVVYMRKRKNEEQ